MAKGQYSNLFRSGDFDAIRVMLGDDVKLDLVNRLQLQGRDKIGLYFTRCAEETKWRFAWVSRNLKRLQLLPGVGTATLAEFERNPRISRLKA